MALRLIHTARLTTGGVSAKVYRDPDWNEYRVRFFNKAGVCEGTYHTDDRVDALNTATLHEHRINERATA